MPLLQFQLLIYKRRIDSAAVDIRLALDGMLALDGTLALDHMLAGDRLMAMSNTLSPATLVIQ
ncbi:hypothetical protein JCM12856_17910 [Spirochaeta dissipatitropha]